MRYVYADLIVRGERAKSIKAIVDTASTYIVLDPKTISEIGLHKTPYEVELTVADKRRVKVGLYLAEVEAKSRKGPAFIAELDVPTPLIGVNALETLGLKPNPHTGELEVIGPEGGYMLCIKNVRTKNEGYAGKENKGNGKGCISSLLPEIIL